MYQYIFFVGTKNQPMLPNFYKSEVKPAKLLCEQIMQSRLSSEKDFMFLKETLTNSKVPVYHSSISISAFICK